MGPVRLNHVLGSVETDKLPLEKKWPRLSPHLPHYYFQGNADLQFMSTFADKTGTCSMSEAQKYSRFHFGASNEDNDIITVNLELSG